ncbi:MAG: SAM-dependent methyltransferase [Myxococcales bacterium]|nr:SAM-dependent methyltransferase [Myxococcales bacterium]
MFTPLQESAVFARQAEVYERLGMRAWSEGIVPWRATTCPLLAEVEAELIAAFDVDVRAAGALAPDDVLTIIDVGAGTGRLGFRLAPSLAARGVRAKLVLTDVSPSNVEALAAHRQLASLASDGLVTFEHFDALSPTPLGDSGTPVLLAHYLFDTLPHRAIRVTREGGFEGLVDVGQEPWAWRYQPAVVPEALTARGEGTFLLPVGAARALTAWRDCFTGPVLVLSADKGVAPRGPTEDPLLARHESVSAGVDFDALASMAPAFRHLSPSTPSDVFALHAFVSARGETPNFGEAWRRRGATNEVLGLLERFAALLKTDPSVDAMFGVLDESRADPDLLAQLAGRLKESALTSSQATHLVQLLVRAAQQHFVFRQQLDVPFTLAITAHHVGALELAVALYLLSLQESGAHDSTLLNLALAQHALGRHGLACEALEVLLAHTADHPRARALLADWQTALEA